MNNGVKHYYEEKEVQYHKHLSECPECAYLASRENARNGAIVFVSAIIILVVTLYVVIIRK